MSPDNFEALVSAVLGVLPKGVTLLAAVSGGADSTAMLVALSRLRKSMGFTLRAAHVEHGIRPPEESRGDAAAVRALCAALDLPCGVLSIPPGKVAEYGRRRGTGLEAAARHYRYRLLGKEARRHGAGAIATAHTGDDALELCLMRVLRGSGPGGLRRMPPSRDFFGSPPGTGGLMVVRPLLSLYRADVESYLGGRGIPWRNDTTNTDERYLRNRIRGTLVPLLDKRFPGWKGGLESLGETQSLAADFIDSEARHRVVWEWADGGAGVRGSPRRNRGRELRCPADVFWGEAPIIREEALFRALNMMGLPRTAPVKRRNLRRFARGERGDLDLGFCRITRTGGRQGGYVSVFRRNRTSEAGFSLLIKGPGLYKLNRGVGCESGIGETALFRVSGRRESPAAPWIDGPGGPGGGERRVFFAALPLALRAAQGDDRVLWKGKRIALRDLALGESDDTGSREGRPLNRGCLDTVVAQDAAGPAAFIRLSPTGAVILWRREIPPNGELFLCDIGGIDV
jgi:tRNA(Ile)-lysidine synthase